MLILDDGLLAGLLFSGVRGRPFMGGPFGIPDGVRKPLTFNFGDGKGAPLLGESGRGNEGRRILGLVVEDRFKPGPTDLLKFVIDGPLLADVAVSCGATARLVTYFELFMGTNMPEPGIEVVK